MKKRIALGIGAAAIAAAALAWRSRSTGDDSTTQRIDADAIAQLKRLSEAVESSRTSALAAFGAADDADHGSLDERAITDIKTVVELVAGFGDTLPSAAVALANEIVERYESAQVQLMSFAINRKNRGHDGAQSEMELADGLAFTRESEALSGRLKEAIETRRL